MGEVTRDEVWESLAPEDRAAIERGTKAYYERWAAGRFPPYEDALTDDEGQEVLADFYKDLIGCPIGMRIEKRCRAEGARQERERIRGLPLTDPIRTAVWGLESELNLEFQDGYDPSVTWRALLAAITEDGR